MTGYVHRGCRKSDDCYRELGHTGRCGSIRKNKRAKADEPRYAGVGGDGEAYGVQMLTRPHGAPFAVRDKPCPTCPWRKDARVGRFPAQAFRESAHTAYDMSRATFACHESGIELPATCAGFILRNSANNFSVRAAEIGGRFDPLRVANREGIELFESYRDMAVANGVDPSDPVLAPCRADSE